MVLISGSCSLDNIQLGFFNGCSSTYRATPPYTASGTETSAITAIVDDTSAGLSKAFDGLDRVPTEAYRDQKNVASTVVAGVAAEARSLLGIFSHPHTTSVKAWPARLDGTICFPELDDPDFAVLGLGDKALIATTLGLGCLHGLQHLGLLNRVRYLSVISVGQVAGLTS
ncbi:hypothetical protein VOLCADRAFT_98333 [Volvox carteri f. nagariensis]|uniref:Uncharacterized protein n=1 Tax=Volvox carteri f. nagariensis TaxID=3068 RepID=D8UF28_VOLCA|nr:uncharacterized protein VOLCADRAFT_98333 [Volvox carteri f. nagariensis]EFJ41645.1 hypothetical protein VOLCADRAFT_98333 [Volvox carteri f. nagariensis]|eukprot:XP_002957301.1 hypothetical protein VOLCADRAFT_98333 [Volvox carteri f. nagariensis]